MNEAECIEEKIEKDWNIDFEEVEEIIQEAEKDGRHQLIESEMRKILQLSGITMAKGTVVRSLEDCLDAAEKIGFPVVLKVVSEDIVHKTDVGGIAVDLETKDEVEDAYQAIHSQVKNRKPDANIRGISVAEMVKGDVEVVIGGMMDPTFGPVVMFGLGGIHVEIFEDVEFRVAPISIDDAHKMMADIDSFPLLTGARGEGCKDLNALAEMISRVGDLIYHSDKINDIDLNPVAALDEGAKALDVAISLN